jgi:hypothetical protein
MWPLGPEVRFLFRFCRNYLFFRILFSRAAGIVLKRALRPLRYGFLHLFTLNTSEDYRQNGKICNSGSYAKACESKEANFYFLTSM